MRSSYRFVVLPAAATALVLGMVGGGAPGSTATSEPPSETAVAARGQASANARSVDVRAASSGPQIAPRGGDFGTLGIDGQPTGQSFGPASIPRNNPLESASRLGAGPNTGTGQTSKAPGIPSTTVNANFPGITQANSNCGGCQPPDPHATVSPTQIAHTVNVRLQVFNKSGTTQCGVGLGTLIGTTERLADPRVQWDHRNQRFSMVLIPIPTAATATPALFLLTSQTSDACGRWWVYRLTFSGSLYPAGTLLDYPYLGQDDTALLSSTNNFQLNATGGFAYINSAVFSIPKAAAYTGARVSFSSFPTGFSTAPATVTGIPVAPTASVFYLRSIPGTGYQLYRMNNSGRPGTTLTALPVAASSFTAPSRRVIQPGTSITLDPLDGRMQTSPFQDESFVWFTHGQDRSGRPGVRYGAISTATRAVFARNASRSPTSDDFNPSIGIADAGANQVRLWLNWAYTDSGSRIATSNLVDGVAPGGGLPDLNGTGLVLANGASTSTNTRFGDYSSVAIDPTGASATCPAGRTAVTAQQIFQADGQWITRISRISFC